VKAGVIVFPGSNCDHDCYHVLKHVAGFDTDFVWHEKKSLKGYDLIVLPGGFSYGDYLRTGAIARFSPVMSAVEKFADRGGLVLGICNGFQILLESGLLPGAINRNTGLHFLCKFVKLSVENNKTSFTSKYKNKQIISIPIAHNEGNYYCDDKTLAALKKNNQIIFKYHGENPNGSIEAIAGICNKKGNVLGMMPHPERCSESELGSSDGRLLFDSIRCL